MKLLVDYAAHPAFRGLAPPGPRSLAQARTYFDTLDDAWRKTLLPSAGAASVDAWRRLDAVQDGEVRALAAALSAWISPEYLVHVLDALRVSAAAIRREIAQIHAARSNAPHADKAVGTIRQSLLDTGVAGFQLGAAPLAQLNAVLAPFRAELVEQRRTNGGARCYVVPPTKGEHWQIMKAFLREQRIEEAISAYAGYSLELEGYAFTYSHEDEDWYRKCYLDLPLAAPRTGTVKHRRDSLRRLRRRSYRRRFWPCRTRRCSRRSAATRSLAPSQPLRRHPA